MGKQNILLIGGGGHCKSVIDVIEQTGMYDIIGIVDVREKVGNLLFGYRVIGTDEEIGSLDWAFDACHITLGMIGSSEKRANLYNSLVSKGFRFPVIQSPDAYVSKHAIIGQGTVIMHNAFVNAGAIVGENCILNTKCLIEHDAVIGDHCHISTGAIINGRVTVGNGSFVGSGAVSKQGSVIPAGAFIKANSIIK